MIDAYLGLGSNLGERAEHLLAGLDGIALLPRTAVVAVSPTYETPPMGPQDQGAYLNLAVRLRTELQADELLRFCLAIEAGRGRSRSGQQVQWGPRTIDIDILLFGEQCIDTPGLTVPHPGMHERWFVLRPLADLNHQVLHPVLGKTAGQLLAEVEAAGVAQGVAV